MALYGRHAKLLVNARCIEKKRGKKSWDETKRFALVIIRSKRAWLVRDKNSDIIRELSGLSFCIAWRHEKR